MINNKAPKCTDIKKALIREQKKEIAPYDAMKLRTTGFECPSPFVIHRAKHTIKAWPAIGEESLSRYFIRFEEFPNPIRRNLMS